MSSTYRVLCLSHDPAVVAADPDWHRPEPAETAVTLGIEGHRHCDLMIARYSGSLTELGCPQSWAKRNGQAGGCCHRETQWVAVDWIRLLLVAQREPAGTTVREVAGAAGVRCWTPARLERLRAELGIEEQQTEPPQLACPDLPGHETHSPPCGFTSLPPLGRLVPPPCGTAHNCPGHQLCPDCVSDMCDDCGGCRCEDGVCAWASYKADCPEVYEAAKAAGLSACAGCGGTEERCVCTGGFITPITEN